MAATKASGTPVESSSSAKTEPSRSEGTPIKTEVVAATEEEISDESTAKGGAFG